MLNIRLATLTVRDYDEAIRFYVDKLGFDLIEDTDLGNGKRWVRVRPPGSSGTALLLAKAVSAQQLASVGNQTGGRVFLFLETDDFWRDYDAFRSRGVVFVRPPAEELYGTVAVFQDLYGNKFDLIQPHPLPFRLGAVESEDLRSQRRRTAMPVKPIRDGFRTVTPYLTVPGVAKLIEFLQKAFDAEETFRVARPDGSIGHAEVRIGDSMVMMGEPTERWKAMPGQVYLYVTDCDGAYRRAIEAGGISVMEPTNMPSGERYGGVKDPSGNIWWPATHLEDLSPKEELRRFAEMKQ